MIPKLCQFQDSKVVETLKKEEVVAFPTETVFGLGAIYDSKKAFDRLVAIKKRTPDKPFTVMVADVDDIEKLAKVGEAEKRIIKRFMPGEITILLPPQDNLYDWVTLNQKTIGIRISASKAVCDLIRRVGKPLLVTSCNISGEPPILNALEAYQKFEGVVEVIVEGHSETNIPSTIVECVDGTIKLIRLGNIPFEMIEKVWKGNE